MRDFEQFEDIPAWQEAKELVKLVYIYTSQGAWALEDCLRDEIRRTSISITTKIAQGFGRQDNTEFRKLVAASRSLVFVLKTHLYIALDLEFIDQHGFDHVSAGLESTLRMIDMLADGLKRSGFRRGTGGAGEF